MNRIRRVVDFLLDDIDRIDVTEQIAHHAGDLAQKYALRAYDAVHLASADAIADDDETVLVTADGDLLAAAERRGLRTAPLGA